MTYPSDTSSRCPHREVADHARGLTRLVSTIVVIGLATLLMGTATPLTASANPSLWDQSSGNSGKPGGNNPSNRQFVTFGVQPATAKGPDGRGYISLSSTPGGRYTDYVAVTNYSLQPLTISLHSTDAVNTPEGDFALLPPDSKSIRFAPWLSLPPEDATLNLGPRATKVVPIALRVPANATPGDHAGGVIATLQSYITSPSGQKVQFLQSVGTRIFVRVSGPLHPGFSVEHLTAKYSGKLGPLSKGRVVLTYTVANTGNVGLGGRQTVSVSGLFGSKTTAKQLGQIQLLLPGYSVKERVIFTGVFPELLMTGHVSISPLVIPGSQQPASGPYQGTVHFWAIPWMLVLIVIVIILALVGWFLLRRRRGRPRVNGEGPSPAGPGEKQPEAVVVTNGEQESDPEMQPQSFP